LVFFFLPQFGCSVPPLPGVSVARPFFNGRRDTPQDPPRLDSLGHATIPPPVGCVPRVTPFSSNSSSTLPPPPPSPSGLRLAGIVLPPGDLLSRAMKKVWRRPPPKPLVLHPFRLLFWVTPFTPAEAAGRLSLPSRRNSLPFFSTTTFSGPVRALLRISAFSTLTSLLFRF